VKRRFSGRGEKENDSAIHWQAPLRKKDVKEKRYNVLFTLGLTMRAEQNPDVGWPKILLHTSGTTHERVVKSRRREARLFFLGKKKKHNSLETGDAGPETFVSKHFSYPLCDLHNGVSIASVLLTRGQLAHRPFAGPALLTALMYP
jgi:hypothetical protein